MSSDALQAEAQAIHERYRQNFAGRSRATRDLSLLDELITGMGTLRGQVASSGDATLLDQVDRWVSLYQTERGAIAETQEGGPDVATAHRLSDWTWLGFQRYMRHFAGQNRLTRDTGLLRALAEEQRRWLGRFEALAARQEAGWLDDIGQQMRRNLEIYDAELTEIPTARGRLAVDRRAGVLATRANGQFALYRLHFAGKQRRSRRLALIKRIIGELSEVLHGMQHLRDQHGVRTDAHLDNIQKVSQRIDHHKREFRLIEDARREGSAGDVAKGLADDANKLFGQYREEFAGQARETRNLDRLGEINEQLQEVARAMSELGELLDSDVHDRNLEIVIDNLKRYEREYRAIREAQVPSVQ